MATERVYFVSDLHFGSESDESTRRSSFLRFLHSIHGAHRLVVAGDLFDFWFDLGSTMPKGFFEILEGLLQLRRSGTSIDYVAGNHDYWRSRFFPDELGITTYEDSYDLETQGRRMRIVHGDGLGPGDAGYKFLKRIVRAPITIGLARLVHPDLLQLLARTMARVSRAHTSRTEPDLGRLESAARSVFRGGHDALVMGHVHVQVHREFGTGELLVIGDWLELRSFVLLEDGVFTPNRWSG